MEAIRNSHGSVGLEVFQGRLRLRLPRKLFNGKQTYLSLGVDDTKLNRKIAEAKIRQIELDILSDNFDSTLAKYKAPTHLVVVENFKPKQQIDLSNLWLKHRDFKQPNRSQSLLMTYNQQTKYLAKCPYELTGVGVAMNLKGEYYFT